MPDVASDLPRDCGAYVLFIQLAEPLSLDLPAFKGRVLEVGEYAYAGSAYGPGGIRARVRRHLRSVKPLRWHVDRMTAVGRIHRIGVRPEGRECHLVGELLSLGGVPVLPGFGSSDCRTCPAHMLALPTGRDLRIGGLDLIRPPR
jgi:Uri superfamily endonuclease